MKIPANGFTHAGKFHADDVFATALLWRVLSPGPKGREQACRQARPHRKEKVKRMH